MIIKPIYLSEVAKDDLADALLNYEQQFAEQAIDGCLNALAKAYKQIGKFPKTGSPKAGNDLNLPGLRSWPLSKYPYLLFYTENHDQIDAWRLLHQKRDIEKSLTRSGIQH